MDIEWSKMPKSKIISLDCTEEYERYFEIGQTTVTGGYRQTARLTMRGSAIGSHCPIGVSPICWRSAIPTICHECCW